MWMWEREIMKRWMVGLFLCYPLFPVAAAIAGACLHQGSPWGFVVAPYYLLMLASLSNLARLPGLPGLLYKGAFATVLLHLLCLAIQLCGPLLWQSKEPRYAMDIATIAIFAVFVLASWAGAALAASRRNHFGMTLQLLAPALIIVSVFDPCNLGGSLVILGFGGQGLHALFLSLAAVEPEKSERYDPGLTPV